MLHRLVWQIVTNVSEKNDASIFRVAYGGGRMYLGNVGKSK
jgi:hypothetical protein